MKIKDLVLELLSYDQQLDVLFAGDEEGNSLYNDVDIMRYDDHVTLRPYTLPF